MERHFGSEVELRASDQEEATKAPAKVDLEALEARPFKDATDAESIRKLGQKLEEVKEEATNEDDDDGDVVHVGKKVRQDPNDASVNECVIHAHTCRSRPFSWQRPARTRSRTTTSRRRASWTR